MEFDHKLLLESYRNFKEELEILNMPPDEIEVEVRKKFSEQELTLIYTYQDVEITELGEKLEGSSPDFQYKEIINAFLKRNPLWYDSKTKLWWIWNWGDLKWEIGSEIDILRIFMHRYQITRWLHPQVQNKLQAALMVMAVQKPKPLPKNYVQLKELIYNVDTGESMMADPKYFSTNPLPHSLGLSEDTIMIDNLLVEWVGKEKKQLLLEILSYCMMNSYPIHKIFALLGVGRNGKSTFMRLLERFIGKENMTSSSVDLLETNRFETSKLKNKLVCQLPELDVGQFKKTALLKRLTGQDLVSFEFKNKNPEEGYNYAKMFMIGNTLPSTLDLSEGFFSRWIIVDFPNQFPEQADPLENIPPEEWENLVLKCVRILKDLLKRRMFIGEGDIAFKRKVFEEKSNILKVFIDSYYEITGNREDFVWKYEFQDNFEDFCKKKSVISWTSQMVNKVLKNEFGLEIDDKKIEYKGESKVWKAIFGLKDKVGSGSSRSSDLSNSLLIYRERVEKVATSATSATKPEDKVGSGSCYRCNSTENLTQIPDSITGEILNICEVCLKEGMVI